MIIENNDRNFANARATNKETKEVKFFTIGIGHTLDDLRKLMGPEWTVNRW